METRRSARVALAAAAVQLLIQQVYLVSSTPQPHLECQNPKTYYDENFKKCCSRCPPGFFVLQSCNQTVDTQCAQCAEETYTPEWNIAGICVKCHHPCKMGFVPEKECTRTQDRFCWCPPQHFCSLTLGKTCLHCQPYQKCPKGFGISRTGTKSQDVECAPCQQGTFSDVESHSASCKPHKICQSEFIPGNRTHDAVCHDLHTPLDTPAATPYVVSTGRRQRASKVPADISSTAGWVAGVAFVLFAAMGGTLICFAFRKKGQQCAPPCGMEKTPFASNKNPPCGWQEDTPVLCTEQQNLLEVSTPSSRSLESSPSSESSSPASSTSDLKVEVERGQSSCTQQSGANLDSAPSGNGKTHVNVSCVVSVCSSDHGTQSCSVAVTAPGFCPSREGLLPLSKEESPIRKETGGQIAVEVEDSMSTVHHNTEESLPLSTQEAGMKTT